MALTREERQAIQTLIRKITKLEDKLDSQEALIDKLYRIIIRVDSKTDMSEWTSEQWNKFLRPYLATGAGSKNSGISPHDHTSEQNGGDCFAKLGANLINGDG